MNWHYTVGSEQFFVKFHAIQESLKSNNPIYFHAPAEYKDFDMSKEPEEPYTELLIQQAKKLRQQFKYLKLNYSGGLDSNLILQIFTDNEIHLDEIQCMKCGIPGADFEIETYAQPKLKDLSLKLKKTKITIVEPTLDDYEEYYKNALSEDKINKGCVSFNTHCRIHYQTYLLNHIHNPDIAVIMGKEKPRVIKHNDDYYTYFLDGEIEPQQQHYNFFIDDPKVNAKQTHLWFAEYKKNTTTINGTWKLEYIWNKHTQRPVDKPYPKKQIYFGLTDNFITHKGNKIYYANYKEKIALNYLLKKAPNILDRYKQFVDQLLSYTKSTWWNSNRPELGPICNFSKFYNLNKNDIKTVDELYPNSFKD